jgi:formylglycine-generating enzyme required for sulfatase activity
MKNKAALVLPFALILALACVSCARNTSISVDETLVTGGALTVGDDVYCARYEATVQDLYVSRYEITWGQFAAAMNYALKRGYAEIRGDKLYSRKGLFPWSYDKSVFNIASCRDRVAFRDGAFAVIESFDRMPLNDVGWYGAAFFCNVLSEANGLSLCYDWDSWEVIPLSRGYRMPTFEEWEYLAKGGASSGGYSFSGSNEAGEVGWFSVNSGDGTHPVGGLKPNELGLYDMSGNVSEFCTEIFRSVITAERTKDSPLKTSNRIFRGGSFRTAAVSTTYFFQNINQPEYYFPFADVGLRTVRAR